MLLARDMKDFNLAINTHVDRRHPITIEVGDHRQLLFDEFADPYALYYRAGNGPHSGSAVTLSEAEPRQVTSRIYAFPFAS